MRVVNISADNPNTVELNFMWLPTFIGQNPLILKELRVDILNRYTGRALTNEVLNSMHSEIISWLRNKFQIVGLDRYLQAIEEVVDE